MQSRSRSSLSAVWLHLGYSDILCFLSGAYQRRHEFLSLCRKLLDDPEPAIRLEAALPLAGSAIMGDPKEARLVAILLPAFERKEIRDDWVDLNRYGVQQQPPGSPGRPPRWPTGIRAPYFSDENQVLVERIKMALIRLEPYLTPEQRSTFRRLERLDPSRADHWWL